MSTTIIQNPVTALNIQKDIKNSLKKYKKDHQTNVARYNSGFPCYFVRERNKKINITPSNSKFLVMEGLSVSPKILTKGSFSFGELITNFNESLGQNYNIYHEDRYAIVFRVDLFDFTIDMQSNPIFDEIIFEKGFI